MRAKRCAIYCRVSSDEQVRDGYSLDEQERAGREKASREGWDVVSVHRDEGKTGTNDNRTQLQAIKALAAAHTIDIIFIRDLSRLARGLKLQEQLIDDLLSAHVHIWQSDGPVVKHDDAGDIDPDSRMLAQIIGSTNERYSRDLARRVKGGLNQKAMQGRAVGPVSFGYAWQYERNANGDKLRQTAQMVPTTDAIIVVEIFTRYVTACYSDLSLAQELNHEGLTFCRRGQQHKRVPFTADTIGGILQNRAYLGEINYQGITRAGTHKPIIDDELFDRVHAIRQRRSKAGSGRKAGTPAHETLLREIVYCGGCGSRLHICTSGKAASRIKYYRCGQRRNSGTCAEPMLPVAIADERMLQLLRSLAIPAGIRDAAIALAQQHLAQPITPGIDRMQVQQRLERLKTLFKLGDMDEQEYLRERATLQSLLADVPLMPRLLDVQRAAALLSDMSMLLDASSPEHQRALLHQVFDTVWMTKAGIRALRPAPAFRLLIGIAAREDADSVTSTGLEPVTSSSGGWRSIH